MQDVGHVFAEHGKPAVLGSIWRAALEDDGIVLVHCQQALAATG